MHLQSESELAYGGYFFIFHIEKWWTSLFLCQIAAGMLYLFGFETDSFCIFHTCQIIRFRMTDGIRGLPRGSAKEHSPTVWAIQFWGLSCLFLLFPVIGR